MIPLINRVMLLLLTPLTIFAQQKPEYHVGLIPDSLKKNALLVKRHDNDELFIYEGGKKKMTSRWAYTVLSESGFPRLSSIASEDKFRKVDFAEVRIYDLTGKQLKKYKKKDLEKAAANDGVSLVNDWRVLYLDVPSFPLPFTVEYETEVSYSGFLELPDFITEENGVAIQSASLTITSSPENKVRYKNFRTGIQPVITENNGKTSWKWEVANVKARKWEPGSPRGVTPRVQITPTYFQMDDYAGDFINWQRLGDWQNKLNEGTSNLLPERFKFFRELVKDIPDTVEKIKRLYTYLQNNYRYVGIQLGIGGFKPFDAAYVDKNKYGDCKALSNFMYTILAANGIRSHYTWVNAGDDESPVDPEFPADGFNHIILCVPMPKDSIWLECTSRDAPFGQLGSFTENRYALLITENGGKLVPTPRSKATDNAIMGKSTVVLQPDGSAQASVTLSHSGSMHKEIRNLLWEQPEHYQKVFLVRYKGFKDYDQVSIEKETVQETGNTRLNMHFTKVPEFSAGSKHFLRPHLYTVWGRELPDDVKERTNDYVLDDAFIRTDTTVWQLPDGYMVENLPASVSFSCPISSFEARYNTDASGKNITAICRLEIKQTRVPAGQYNDARIYFQRVVKELQQMIIIKRGG